MLPDISNETIRIACIGECMVELSDLNSDDGRVALGIAGDTLNTAIYLSRLLPRQQFQISYLTRVGVEAMSDRVLHRLDQEGIDTSFIGQDPSRNVGIYSIDVDETGERSFTYWRSQSSARRMFSEGRPSFEDFDRFSVIYLSAITLAILPPAVRNQLIEACRKARARGRIVVFDSNYRPALWENSASARDAINRMWAVSSIAFPSYDDEKILYPGEKVAQTLHRIASSGAGEVVLKCGSDGPVLWPEAGEVYFPPSKVVIDTTGAGDSFNAGYLAARLTGSNRLAAAQNAHKLACDVVASPGAILPKSRIPD